MSIELERLTAVRAANEGWLVPPPAVLAERYQVNEFLDAVFMAGGSCEDLWRAWKAWEPVNLKERRDRTHFDGLHNQALRRDMARGLAVQGLESLRATVHQCQQNIFWHERDLRVAQAHVDKIKAVGEGLRRQLAKARDNLAAATESMETA